MIGAINRGVMKIGIIISTNDAEKCWNAIRFATFCLDQKTTVKIFLLGQGVECEKISDQKFNVDNELHKFLQANGKIYACGTCIELRHQHESNLCPISTLKELYDIVNESDKVLTF